MPAIHRSKQPPSSLVFPSSTLSPQNSMANSMAEESLVEERDAEMVVFNGSQQQPIKRKGLFLNPTSSTSRRPNAAVSAAAGGEPKYHPRFRWWADPPGQWDQWVEKLKLRYDTLWKKAGIFDAIMASTLRIRRDPPSLLGLARFWSKETSTFLFPWGEATVTLEDVMVLGGFSVFGEPVRAREPLGGVIGHMVSKMMGELNGFKRKCPKAEHSAWMKHYVGRGGETEHIAFLSLWLSRFVLIAANGKTIREVVFQVAVRLATGTRIALAPAVLASIYRDLRAVRNHVCTKSSSLLAVWSPLNVLQIWVWERFHALRPELRTSVSADMPRAARWSVTGQSHDSSAVLHVLESADEFEWRPYEVELRHWPRPSFYVNEGGWFFSNVTQDEELQSFARCLRVCELLGLDCTERYQPHRVAMQFALDQDIPKVVPQANIAWELAWEEYDISLKNVKFYVPPRLSSSAVTLQYYNWWRNLKKEDDVGAGKKRKGTQPLPNSKKQKVGGFNETKSSARPVPRDHEVTVKPLHADLNRPSEIPETMNQSLDVIRGNDFASEKQQKQEHGPSFFSEQGIVEVVKKMNAFVDDEKITEVVKKTNPGELHHDLTATEKSKEKNKKQLEEEPRPEALDVEEERIMKDPMKINVAGFDHEQTVAGKPEPGCRTEETTERDPSMKKLLECEPKGNREETNETKERDPTRKKELERDMKINQLKEEIASILVQIRYWESLAEGHSKL